MAESEYIQVGEAPLAEAKRLQGVLELRGVALQLASNPEDCNSCSPKVALFIRQPDLEKFQELLRSEYAKSLGDLQPDAAHQGAVFDSEKAEATCPACGTVFSTALSECPDCGLGFGVG